MSGGVNLVLIVDDQQIILDAFTDLLEQQGIRVDTSKTLEEALALIDQNAYDFVITDLRLSSDISEEGLRIVRHARNRRPHARIMLWTGFGNQAIRRAALEAGADYFFEKPVAPFKVLEILREPVLIVS